MQSRYVKPLFIFSLFLVLFFPAGRYPSAAVDDAATVSIPEVVLLRTIRDVLPLPLEAQSRYVQGDLIVKSLESLEIREKSIFLTGILAGRNFKMNATVAGRDISLDLGSAQLPVSCELFLRFDGENKRLLVTPHFPKPKSLYTTDPGDALLLLLSALAEKEYPVELAAIRPILANVGSRSISVELEPVDIQTRKDVLLIKMRPKVAKGP